MTTNCTVTLWHFDSKEEIWMRSIFPRAFCDYKKKLSKSGIKQMGFYSADSAKIRIPTTENIDISVGDYIYIGECYDDAPVKIKSLKVVEVRDNRVGGAPHWRIVCGG